MTLQRYFNLTSHTVIVHSSLTTKGVKVKNLAGDIFSWKICEMAVNSRMRSMSLTHYNRITLTQKFRLDISEAQRFNVEEA